MAWILLSPNWGRTPRPGRLAHRQAALALIKGSPAKAQQRQSLAQRPIDGVRIEADQPSGALGAGPVWMVLGSPLL